MRMNIVKKCEPIKVLGVHLSYNNNNCIEENFCGKIKMKTKFFFFFASNRPRHNGKSFRYITAVCSICAERSRIGYEDCSKESVRLCMEKQERQNKKNGYVSTSRKGRN